MVDIEISEVLRLPAAHDDTSPGIAFALRPCTSHRLVEVWDGLTWDPWTTGGTSEAIAFTPVGTISATTVQAAVAELDAEIPARISAETATKLDSEQVMDMLGTVGLVQGDNISLEYDDLTGTITVHSSASSEEPVGAVVERVTPQPLTTQTWTSVSYDAADLDDTDAIHDPATNNTRFTVPAGMGGKWRFSATAEFEVDTTGVRGVAWAKNGTDLPARYGAVYRSPSPVLPTVVTTTVDLLLNDGDYVEHRVYHEAGADLDLTSAYLSCEFLEAGGGLDAEGVRDTMGLALVSGTNVTVVPSDAGDTITIHAATDPEVVRDTVATALVGGPGVVVTPDDTGNTITVTGPVSKIRTADQTASNTTLVDESGQLTFTIAAGQVWVIDYNLLFTCPTATPDVKIAIAGTGTVTGSVTHWGVPAGATTVEQTSRAIHSAALGGTGSAFGVVSAATGYTPIRVRAVVDGGASGGTAKVQFCQNVNDAVNVVSLRVGSSAVGVKV